MRYFPISILFFTFSFTSFSQSWLEEAEKPGANFFEIRKKFYEWRGENPHAKGMKQFQRWEYFLKPRIFSDGSLPEPDIAAKELQKFQHGFQNSPLLWRGAGPAPIGASGGEAILSTGNWVSFGPGVINSGTYAGYGGRIDVIRLEPGNPNVIYAGSPSGGLWKSTNGGSSWVPLLDNEGTLAVSDVAINPNNVNEIYVATGNKDLGTAHPAYSLGVLRSTDGGATWAQTGLNWQTSQAYRTGRILIVPSSANTLVAATSNGLYVTTDGGTNWTQKLPGNFKDAEMHPANDNIIYAASTTQIFRSADMGNSWTQVTSGLPASDVQRIALVVTPAAPNIVYALYARNSTSEFMGLYKSSDSGLSWAARSTSGLSLGGYAWYAMTLHASPVDSNLIAAGGINGRISQNGGQTWSGGVAGYDFHGFEILPGSNNTCFSGSDMGLRKISNLASGGSSYTNLNYGGIKTMLVYEIGVSAQNPDIVFTGNQDIGTHRYNNSTGTLDIVQGTDGGYSCVDYLNANIVYASTNNGSFFKSTTGGGSGSFTNITPAGQAGTGSFISPFALHTQNPQVLYAGYTQLWRSTNAGSTWAQTAAISGTGTIRSLAVAPSNGDVVYCARLTNIYRTTNGGGAWSTLTGSLPVSSANIGNIAVHSNSPDTVWVCFSGFSAGNKVFKSTNGGQTWSNISSNLPNVPVNCMVHDPASADDGIYAGTDIGVFYTDNTLGGNWIPFNTGLPNVIVADMEIIAGKITAGTHGRGLWRSDTYAVLTSVQNSQTSEDEIQVFPNPNKGFFTVEFSFQPVEPVLLQVFSMNGKLIYQNKT